MSYSLTYLKSKMVFSLYSVGEFIQSNGLNSFTPIQVPCPFGHIVTGRFCQSSVLRKVKRLYSKKQQNKGWSWCI